MSVCRVLGLSLLAAAGLFFCGCTHPECAQYAPYVHSEESRDKLLTWVDKEIFSKSLLETDLSGSVLLGPGKNRIRSVQGEGLSLPGFFSELSFSKVFTGRAPQVLLLGEDLSKPIAIFIGRVSYRGLIVSREEISPTLRQLSLYEKRDFSSVGNRVAIMCYSD